MSDNPRTLLIIAYELPPSAGGGVQRVTKFVRYLPREGWGVRVVAAHPMPGRPRDDTLVEQVVSAHITRVPARNIAVAIAGLIAPLKRRRVSKAPVAAAPTTSAPLAAATRRSAPVSARIARWIGFPDETALWIRPAVRAALLSAREHPVDAVLATAPPFSTLVVGERVARALRVPLVIDMRDSWRDNSAFTWPSAWHKRRAVRLERRLLERAALVTVVSDGIAQEASELGAGKVAVIPNGFDPANVPRWAPKRTDGLDIVFIGRLYANASDPTTLFDALVLLRDRDQLPAGLRATFIGSRTPWITGLVAERGLENNVEFRDFMPYADAIAAVAASDVGFIPIADGPGARAMFTGKLFDYLGVGIPILIVGPSESAAAALVLEANAGIVAGFADIEDIAAAILEFAARKAAGTAGDGMRRDVIERFDRRAQVAGLARLLDDITGDPR